MFLFGEISRLINWLASAALGSQVMVSLDLLKESYDEVLQPGHRGLAVVALYPHSTYTVTCPLLRFSTQGNMHIYRLLLLLTSICYKIGEGNVFFSIEGNCKEVLPTKFFKFIFI